MRPQPFIEDPTFTSEHKLGVDIEGPNLISGNVRIIWDASTDINIRVSEPNMCGDDTIDDVRFKILGRNAVLIAALLSQSLNLYEVCNDLMSVVNGNMCVDKNAIISRAQSVLSLAAGN